MMEDLMTKEEMNGTYWIEEKKFTNLLKKLKEIGLHCSYPSEEDLAEMLSDIRVKVIRKVKKGSEKE